MRGRTAVGDVIYLPGSREREASGPTFHELAEEWLATEGARLVEPENERRHVDHLRAIWSLSEAELRPRIAKEALGRLLRPLGPLGAATVNKVRGTARRIIREAQLNDRWLGPNPFEIVRRQRQAKPTHRVLSLEEARALLPQLRPDRRREALLMLYLGPRPGEWKALRRSDVDLRARTLLIHRSNGRNETKTGKPRELPIPEALMPVLIEALDASPPDCDLVFPAKDGQRQDAHAKLSRTLKDALRRAGLVTGWRLICRRKGCGYTEERREHALVPCPRCGMKLWPVGLPIPVRFYDLRHSCATLHRRAGADPLAIQIALGHAPETLTDSLYTHLTIEDVRRELSKLRI